MFDFLDYWLVLNAIDHNLMIARGINFTLTWKDTASSIDWFGNICGHDGGDKVRQVFKGWISLGNIIELFVLDWVQFLCFVFSFIVFLVNLFWLVVVAHLMWGMSNVGIIKLFANWFIIIVWIHSSTLYYFRRNL